MATIRRRKDRYQVQVRREGYAPISRSFLALVDAKQWARTKELEADHQELGPSRKSLQTLLLSTLVERYRDTVVPLLKAKRSETYFLNAFLRHSICRKPLSDLTTADFASFRDEKLKTMTAKSLQRMLSPVNHMFSVAVTEWSIPLKENPLAKLQLKVIDDKRTRRLQAGELDRIVVASAETRNPYTLLVVRFALETGMRRSEILNLRWAQVDLPRRSVTVLESKNGYSRTIPLPSIAVASLEQAKVVHVRQRGAELTMADNVFPVSENAFKLSWQRLVTRAKIDNLHFHDLRHERISSWFEAGLSVPEVASISGHRTISMLMRYAHANNVSVRAKLGIVQPTVWTSA